MKKQIEKELREAIISPITLEKNRTAVRAALQSTITRNVREAKKKKIGRAVFSMGMTVGFALGIALVWMLQTKSSPSDSVQPEITATNLGTVWRTYSDNGTGGCSVVWPPESTEEKNNFVKSAPGYGEKGYAVRFTGKAGEQSRAGFIGVNAMLGPPCPAVGCSGVNIRQFEKVRFKMKGRMSGGELVLRISNVTDNASEGNEKVAAANAAAYEARITDMVSNNWQTVTLDLRSDFKFEHAQNDATQIEDILADAKNLKWHVRNGKGATVDVWIDELEFF